MSTLSEHPARALIPDDAALLADLNHQIVNTIEEIELLERIARDDPDRDRPSLLAKIASDEMRRVSLRRHRAIVLERIRQRADAAAASAALDQDIIARRNAEDDSQPVQDYEPY